MFKKAILASALLWCTPALAQNVTCTTRPAGDSTNACASTAFVGTASTNLLSTPNTWTALQTFQANAVFGANGGTGATLTLNGATSGGLIQSVLAVAGTPSIVWGTSSGTPAVTASAPLAITAATGNATCATCATTTNGGALSATAPVTISAAGVVACATCNTGSNRQIIGLSSIGGTVPQAATGFELIGFNGGETAIAAICPIAGTFKNLFISTSPAPAAGQTLTATWRVNLASTAITCIVTGTGTTCNDTTHTATCTTGQLYDVQLVTSATTGTLSVAGGIEFDNP
jgi:hypothetical protein